jgi:hypothetical protein
MAYNIIRMTEFPGRDGAGYKVELRESGGAAITIPDDEATGELQLDAEPLIATYQMQDLPWGPRFLNVELRLLNEDALLQTLRGGDEEQYRLYVYKGGWDNTQAWGSQVTSAALQYIVKVRPKKTERIIQDRVALQIVHADDGLEQLQYYGFVDGSGDQFTGRNEIGDIIHTILGKLNFGIGFVHASNWFCKSAATATVDGFKSNTYGAKVDQEWIYERIREQSGGLQNFTRLRKPLTNLLRLVAGSREPETDPPSCLDVLNLLLMEWQLVLYQAAGGWWIEQIAERHSTLTPYVWLYDSSSSLTDNDTSDNTTVGTLGLVYTDTETAGVPDGDYSQIGEAKEWQMPALTFARVRYQHDAISSDLVPSSGFRDWDSATGYPRGWSRNGTKLDPFQSYLDQFDPAMGYNYTSGSLVDTNLLSDDWAGVKALGNYMYATSPNVVVVSGDSMSFRFRCRYNFANPPNTSVYPFRAYAQVLETTSGKYLSGTTDTTHGETTMGGWSVDDDNRIDLLSFTVNTQAGLGSGVIDVAIDTDTDLGLPTGTCNFKLILWDGTDDRGDLDRIHWGCPEIIYSPQDSGENEETIVKAGATQNGIETAGDFVFYFGTGPVAGSSSARITYGSSDTDPTDEYIVLDDGTGTETTTHAERWVVDLLKMRRYGPIVYNRAIRCTDNAWEGEHHLREGSNYYFAHRLQRLYRSGIADAQWAEIRQDDPEESITTLYREWPKKKKGGDKPTENGYKTPFDNPGCFLDGTLQALYPMIEASPATLKNDIDDVSSSPNGTLAGSIANWTWGDAGLSKTASGTTEYVALPVDLMGSTTVSAFYAFVEARRDTTSEISILRMTAGATTVIELKILTTGVVRLAVTDEGSTTTNLDSNVTIGSDEWAGIGFSIRNYVSFATFQLGVLNADYSYPVTNGTHENGAEVSLDFTDAKLFYSNELTLRIAQFLGNQTLSATGFLAEAICARQFTEDSGVDPGDIQTPTDVVVFTTDDGFEVYSLDGTQQYACSDATYTPGGVSCRPAWHPGLSKVFRASGQYVISYDVDDVDGSTATVEYDSGAGISIRCIQYDKYSGRLYVAESDGAGADDFGYLSGASGAMSWNSLTTSLDIGDFYVDGGHNILVYYDLSSSDLLLRDLTSFLQMDGLTESNSAAVYYVRQEQGVYRMETGGDVYRQYASSVDGYFTATKKQVVDGSGFTSPRSSTLMVHYGEQFIILVANDHILVAPAAGVIGVESPTALTSASFADIATLADVCRGACLAQLVVATQLPAPTLTVGTETATTVPLSWTNLTGETQYVLQRADDDGGAPDLPGVTVDTFAADVTSDTRTGETPETSSWWRIRGGNAAGPGLWSDWVQATTEAVTVVIGVLNYNTSKIDVLSPSDFSTISSLSITAPALDLARGQQKLAYHSGIDRFLYLAQGSTYIELHSIKTDGTSDTVAHTFSGGKTPLALWALSNGAVWVFAQPSGTAAWMRWASADINVDTTWDSPTTDEAGGDLYAQASIDGSTGEGVTAVGRTGGASGAIYRLTDYTNWPTFVSWKDETVDITKAFHDTVGDRIFYYLPVAGTGNDTIQVMADSAAAADTTVITTTSGIGGDSPGGPLIFDNNESKLYYVTGASRYLRRCDDDGSNDELVYDSGGTSYVTGVVVADIS